MEDRAELAFEVARSGHPSHGAAERIERTVARNKVFMYGSRLYKYRPPMVNGKTLTVSYRVTPRFKALLEAAAARENRSQTNMLETLLFAYCEQHGLELPASALRINPKDGA